MSRLESRAIVAIASTALFLFALASVARTSLGKPSDGGKTTQNVNVVNTPTVNIGTGGPIGVDVLTLPSQPVGTSSIEKPQYVLGSIAVPAFRAVGTFTYTPSAGKRAVIKSVMIGSTSDFVRLEIGFSGQSFLLSKTGPALETTISLPSGPFSIVYVGSGYGDAREIPVLVSFYEVPDNL